MDLVFSIVCDIAPVTFNKKEELATLMLVCKDCMKSKIVQNSMHIHKARYFLDELHNNTIALVVAIKNGDITDTMKIKEQEIMGQATATSDIQDCFNMGLMAQYKEMIYECINDPYFRNIDHDIMKEYERIVGSKDAVYNHIHDPEHHMFDDGNAHNYSFYYYCEMYGYSVLDLKNEDPFDNEDEDDEEEDEDYEDDEDDENDENDDDEEDDM